MKVADRLQPVRVILDGVWIVALALGWIRIDPVPVVLELCLAAPLQFTFKRIALLVEGRVGGNQIDGFGVEASEDAEVVAQIEGVELEIRRLRRTIVRGGGGGVEGFIGLPSIRCLWGCRIVIGLDYTPLGGSCHLSSPKECCGASLLLHHVRHSVLPHVSIRGSGGRSTVLSK